MTDLHNSYANARDKNIDLDVTPVTGTIGAIVNGVQLSGDLPAATVQAIQAALVRDKVLFFRDPVAIWDNQSTQHRATADFGLQRRTLRRATISGDVPVGIDGQQSRTVRKEKAVQYEPA